MIQEYSIALVGRVVLIQVILTCYDILIATRALLKRLSYIIEDYGLVEWTPSSGLVSLFIYAEILYPWMRLYKQDNVCTKALPIVGKLTWPYQLLVLEERVYDQ